MVVALIIRLSLGSPVFFRQDRVGWGNSLFKIIKFRTMTDYTDAAGRPLADDQRLTKLGRFLRSTSLDELPELLNVLRGDMSLIGPRPLLAIYLPRFTSAQLRRHEVRPGITGFAQVTGRNLLSWEEKFQLDIWYVDNHNIFLDAKIMALTIWKVIRREAILSLEGAAPEFRGTALDDDASAINDVTKSAGGMRGT